MQEHFFNNLLKLNYKLPGMIGSAQIGHFLPDGVVFDGSEF